MYEMLILSHDYPILQSDWPVEIPQWRPKDYLPDPFPHERVVSGYETSYHVASSIDDHYLRALLRVVSVKGAY